MKTQSSIGIIPLYCITMLAVGLMNHVLVLPPLLRAAERDAWLSVAASTLPYLLWISMLYFIMKRTQQRHLLNWLKSHYGKAVSELFRVFFIIYLAVISIMTLRETAVWAHVSYLPRTPLLVLILSLAVVCMFAVRSGLRSIAYSSGILLPFVIIFGDFVMSANLPEKNYSILLPVMEKGWGPFLQGGIYIGSGLVELITLLLLQHNLKSKVKPWYLHLFGLSLVLLTLGPVIGAITEFGPVEAAKLRYPAYEEWRLVKIGKYITHVDFLSIYQWLAGAFVRISIAFYLLLDLLSIKNDNKRFLWIIVLSIVFTVAAALPYSDMHYLFFARKVYFPASLGLVLLMSFILMMLVHFAKHKKGASHGE